MKRKGWHRRRRRFRFSNPVRRDVMRILAKGLGEMWDGTGPVNPLLAACERNCTDDDHESA